MAPRKDAGPDGDRALARLRQLAAEEKAAARRGDVDAVCHIAGLLGGAMELAESALRSGLPEAREVLREASEAHAAAEELLLSRMAAVRERLSDLRATRRATRAYAAPRPSSSALLNEQR